MNSNFSSGFQDQEAYECFEIEYDTFIKKCQTEGCPSSTALVGSRSPLQLAVMISPIYLLMTFRLSTKSFHRRTVIHLAAKLGPHKTPRILAVESAIWDAIFRLAEGRISVYRVLCDLAKSLPWSDIEEASNCDADKEWFTPPLRMFVSSLEVHHSPNNMSCSYSNTTCPYQILSATD